MPVFREYDAWNTSNASEIAILSVLLAITVVSWSFLEIVIKGFLLVPQVPSLLHWLMVSDEIR